MCFDFTEYLDGKFIDKPTVSSQFSPLRRFSGFFLGHNILRYQNTPLNTVLQMKCELPPVLIEGNQYFFPNIYNKSTLNEIVTLDCYRSTLNRKAKKICVILIVQPFGSTEVVH